MSMKYKGENRTTTTTYKAKIQLREQNNAIFSLVYFSY